jgi:DNA-directed RNA polymerase specialized sigma24 family protein
MNTPNLAMSRLVKAIDALPSEQREVYRARYVLEEQRDETCKRTGITSEEYDVRLKDAIRALRRGTMSGAAGPAQQ